MEVGDEVGEDVMVLFSGVFSVDMLEYEMVSFRNEGVGENVMVAAAEEALEDVVLVLKGVGADDDDDEEEEEEEEEETNAASLSTITSWISSSVRALSNIITSFRVASRYVDPYVGIG
jgi:hypothetical protein